MDHQLIGDPSVIFPEGVSFLSLDQVYVPSISHPSHLPLQRQTKAHRSVRVRSMLKVDIHKRICERGSPTARARGVTVRKHSNEPFLPSVMDERPVWFPKEAVPCYQSVFFSATCCQLTCLPTQMSSRQIHVMTGLADHTDRARPKSLKSYSTLKASFSHQCVQADEKRGNMK